MKKRQTTVFVAAGLALLLAGCGAQKTEAPASGAQTETEKEARKETSLELWTYPVGDWGTSSVVANLLDSFQKEYPEYRVSVQYLDYASGDEKIAQAKEEGKLPDLVLEGPERLVAGWGSEGLMADLSDLWESENAAGIYESVRDACRHGNGAYYEFPLCMTAHCMVVNRDMCEAAGALQYLDEESRTWSTEDFISAVEALVENGQENVGIIYCGGQGGDQGTRALVTNLYGGMFTDEDHTKYVFNSPENIQALELLSGLEGIHFDKEALGADEIEQFAAGKLAMAFCWNVSQEITQIVKNPELDFDMLPMAFPTSEGEPTLQGGIWGFGIFDNGDEDRIEAAKTFIRFVTENDSQYAKAVLMSTYWPVRELPELYANDALMSEYGIFAQYMGDYYQVTPGWADARTAWWTMLQKIGDGTDVAEAVEEFEAAANSAAQAAGGAKTQESGSEPESDPGAGAA